MEDHRLGDLLRELPREQARPGFTARVARNAWTPRSGAASIPRLALAGAGLALVADVTVGRPGGRAAGRRGDRPRPGRRSRRSAPSTAGWSGRSGAVTASRGVSRRQ